MAKCPVGTEVQSLLFPVGSYSAKRAKHWAKEHGYRAGFVDTTESYHRIRQQSPADFRSGSFRTISFGKGVKAIIGCPV